MCIVVYSCLSVAACVCAQVVRVALFCPALCTEVVR